jgi:hypothetical protein
VIRRVVPAFVAVVAVALLVFAVIGGLAACGVSNAYTHNKPATQHCIAEVTSGDLTTYTESTGVYTAAQCAASYKAGSEVALASLPVGLSLVCTDGTLDVYMTPGQVNLLNSQGIDPASTCEGTP